MKEKTKKLSLALQEPIYWKDKKEVSRIMDQIPDYFWEILLQLQEKPLSREEIYEAWQKLEIRTGYVRRKREKEEIERRKKMEARIDNDIACMTTLLILEEKDEKFHLTPGGREIAEHAEEAIPHFVGLVFSPKVVSIITVTIHTLLTILKLVLGFISQSAGLIADGIDNGVDTASSVFIWVGIKLNKEKLVSIFVILMMFASVGLIGYESYNKLVNPEPVERWVITFIITLFCGFLLLILSGYQYMTGKQNNNFAIMCQSVDSRNHFITSLFVGIGILLSFIAGITGVAWLFYADAVASIIIGILILKSAIELTIELLKSGGDPTKVSHFMGKSLERIKAKMIASWLSNQLLEGPLNTEQLDEKFTKDFCEQAPKVLILTGLGYCPENCDDLHEYLDRFVEKKRLIFSDGKYMLPPDS